MNQHRPVEVAVRPTRWPWVGLALFIAIATAAMVLVVANAEPIVEQVPFLIAFTMFGVVGAIVVSRDRHNRIGLLLLYAAFITAIGFLGGELTTWLLEHGHHGPGVQLAATANYVGWVAGILPVVFLLPLLFPDGHIPSPRWRPFLWLIVAALVAVAAKVALGQRTLTGSKDTIGIHNPLYVEFFHRVAIPDVAFFFTYLAIFAGGIVSLVFRFRRSAGIERQQIKWVMFGLAVAFLAIAFGGLIGDPTLNAIVTGAGFLIFPVSVGVAILRFHLYDLDVVVRKTVVYAVLAAAITGLYVAVVAGIPLIVGGTSGGSNWLTFGATILLVVLFQPLRDRARRLADRLVYGRRASPYEVLSAFSERVGETYAEDDILQRMATVVGEGIGADEVDVWLRAGDRLRKAAAWPAAVNGDAPSVPFDPAEVSIDGADATYPVEHLGEVLGALSVTKPANDPLSPADRKLVTDLSSQAGLVLRNVGLTADLRAKVVELRAAQKRIVSAQDEERRKLERNIHDGAQQQLVALTVKARLARTFAERDPAKSAEMLSQIEAETQSALEDLRDLARGIYPPLLADKGLPDALAAQVRKAAMPVDLRVSPELHRFSQEVEAAAYFCTLEALQNVAKYASASRVQVDLEQDGSMLRFRVVDDGCGFDPSAVRAGTGLQGMADRLAALDGELDLTSTPGRGTTVQGRIPVGVEGSV
jgi:signal transduction histidine kinase